MSQLVFCESSGWWATKFRQICGDWKLPVRETRLLEDLQDFVQPSSDALIAIEVKTTNIVQAAAIVKEINRSGSNSRCVALISRDLSACQGHIRATGFIDVFSTPAELPRLARLTKQHINLLPEQNLTWRQAIRQRMPWHPLSPKI